MNENSVTQAQQYFHQSNHKFCCKFLQFSHILGKLNLLFGCIWLFSSAVDSLFFPLTSASSFIYHSITSTANNRVSYITLFINFATVFLTWFDSPTTAYGVWWASWETKTTGCIKHKEAFWVPLHYSGHMYPSGCVCVFMCVHVCVLLLPLR